MRVLFEVVIISLILISSATTTRSQPLYYYPITNRYQALMLRIAIQRQNIRSAHQLGHVIYQPYIVWLTNRLGNNFYAHVDNTLRSAQHVGNGIYKQTDKLLRPIITSSIPALADSVRSNAKSLYDDVLSKTPNPTDWTAGITDYLSDSSRHLKDVAKDKLNAAKDRLPNGSDVKNRVRDKLAAGVADYYYWTDYLSSGVKNYLPPDTINFPTTIPNPIEYLPTTAVGLNDRFRDGMNAASEMFNNARNGLYSVAGKTVDGGVALLLPLLLDDGTKKKRNGLKNKLKKAKNLKDNLSDYAAAAEYLPYIKTLVNVASYFIPFEGQYKEAKLAIGLGKVAWKAANNYKNGDSSYDIATKMVVDAVKALRRRSPDEFFDSSPPIGYKLNTDDMDRSTLVKFVGSLTYPQLPDEQELEMSDDVASVVDEVLAEDLYYGNDRNDLIDVLVKVVKYLAVYEILPDLLSKQEDVLTEKTDRHER